MARGTLSSAQGRINGRSVATVHALLDRGAELEGPDGRGWTAHRQAVRHGRRELCALLEARGADPTRSSDEDRALGP